MKRFYNGMIGIILFCFCGCHNQSKEKTILVNDSPIDSLIGFVPHHVVLLKEERFRNEKFKESSIVIEKYWFCSSYESKNFNIILKYYGDGKLLMESIEEKKLKQKYLKEFYENGQLKMEGTGITANHNQIGTWNYYSSSGTLDSSVDYDKKYPISYFTALEIAKARNLFIPEIDVGLDTSNDRKVWCINSLRKGQNIYIDVETGEVKPAPDILYIH
jgi:hypothetical protein